MVWVSTGVFLAIGAIYYLSARSVSASVSETKSCDDHCDLEKSTAGKEVGHDAHDEHDEHDAHEAEAAHQDAECKDEHGHDEHGHGEEKCVVLTEAQLKKFDIKVAPAGPGTLRNYLTLPGEVTINADRVAHIVPRVSGVVREVKKNLGDVVKKGEVLAILESRELADAKAGFLAAHERLAIAQTNFTREEQLWKQKISAEQEYLQAKQVLAEAKIELRSLEQKLHALGLSDANLAKLPSQEHMNFTRYEIVAPFDATIIEKHLTLGEAVKDDSDIFTLADLQSVWVIFDVHQKDLTMIQKDQPVIVRAGHGISDAEGKIAYIAPIIGKNTRTTPIRVVLPNPTGQWRPGLFVTGQILVENIDVPVLVPAECIMMIDGKSCVFVKTQEGFEPQPVTLGRTTDTLAEITSGLSAGQSYADKGAYTLKLELGKFKGDPCGGH